MFKFILSLFVPKRVSSESKKLLREANDKSYIVVNSDDMSKKRSLIVEYDSILGKILSDLYGKNSVSENLKKAKNRFSKDDYNFLWFSHKIRNTIIHEPERNISTPELNKAINNFKKILVKIN